MGKLTREMSAAPEENLPSAEQRERLAEEASIDEAEAARNRPFKVEEWTYDPKTGDMTNKVTGEVIDGDAFNERVNEARSGEANPFEDDDYSQVPRGKGGSKGR